MSFEEYLHEKAAESRHRETVGFSFLVLGMVMLIGGFLITLVVAGNPDWFYFIPWKRTSDPTSLISLSMTLSGFVLVISGAAYVVFASADRSWYLKSLKETMEDTPRKEEELFRQRIQDLKRKIENLQDKAETTP
jgi:hypothetical protein